MGIYETATRPAERVIDLLELLSLIHDTFKRSLLGHKMIHLAVCSESNLAVHVARCQSVPCTLPIVE